MAPTINATVGSASANSFVTAAAMTAHCDARLNASVWTGADAQLAALTSATGALNALMWEGLRVDEVQALAWPRRGVVNRETGQLFDEDALPVWLTSATCELALEALKAGTTDIFALPSTEGVIEKTVGPLTTRWAEPYTRSTGLRRYPAAWALIAPYVIANGVQVPLVRG